MHNHEENASPGGSLNNGETPPVAAERASEIHKTIQEIKREKTEETVSNTLRQSEPSRNVVSLLPRVEEYVSRGWAPVPIPHRSKNPSLGGWQRLRLQNEDLAHHFAGLHQNVGILLGAPSGGLVDIDLDCPEAQRLATTFLPKTGLVFGRHSKPRSHFLYRATPLVQTSQFKDEEQQMLLELRSTGTQTLFPPSTHPTGELTAFYLEEEPAEVTGPELHACVRQLAAACLLVRAWPKASGRHHFALPLSGMLLRGGLSIEQAERLIRAVAIAANDEEVEDRVRCVRSTALALKEGKRVTGLTNLAQELGEQNVKKLRMWLGLGKEAKREELPVLLIPPASSGLPSIETTDSGNAEHFARMYGDRVRYDYRWERWLVWQDHYFRPDTSGLLDRWAKESMQKLYVAAVEIKDAQLQQRIAKHAISSRSAGRISAFLSLAKSELPIAETGDNWDKDPWLLGVPNGVLDLRTGHCRPGRVDDGITMRAGVAYDPNARCPRFEQFLKEIFAGQEELIDFVWRYAGYSLTGITDEQFLTMHHGGGSNGKSTLLLVLREMMGEYAHVLPFSALEDWSSQRVPTEIADLAGRRLVIASEVNEGAKLNEGRIKALTGCDPITARHLFERGFTFRPVAKFWLAVNHRPRVSDDSYGFWRRVALLPYQVKFKEGEKADPELEKKLLDELPGILNWALRGCLEWQRRRLKPFPEMVKNATEEYREEEDHVGQFLSACCVLHKNAKIQAGKLYQAYRSWAETLGMGERDSLSATLFGRRMSQRFPKKASRTNTTYYEVGLRDEDPS